jgi:hypothetical protein
VLFAILNTPEITCWSFGEPCFPCPFPRSRDPFSHSCFGTRARAMATSLREHPSIPPSGDAERDEGEDSREE